MKMKFFFTSLIIFFLFSGFGIPDQPESSDLYSELRNNMVDRQIISRGISDKSVLHALRTVPRHLFVPETDIQQSYADHAVPIGYGQTISQPYIVAIMTELLKVESDDRVLEIGTGSGYQAAVLSMITEHVYTVEIIEELAESSGNLFKRLGYTSIELKTGDGYYGWAEKAPFDKIIVTAAAGHVPPDLIRQLKPGGIMLIPIGRQYAVQFLTVIKEDIQGKLTGEQILPVRFVPFVGQAEK